MERQWRSRYPCDDLGHKGVVRMRKYLTKEGITKLKALISAAFVGKSQGSANAGKVLGIGADGSVVLTNGAIQMTKLWENASPNSNFAAQTVALELSAYDGVLIQIHNPRSGSSVISKAYVNVGSECRITLDSVYFCYRNLSVSSSGITFDNVDKQTRGFGFGPDGWTVDNGTVIPLTIWGVKEA